MVDLYAAIGVDRHQSTRLVELGGGETDAKLHRRDGDTALDDRVLGIESTDLFAAFSVVAVCRQLGHEARQDVVFHRHAIGCGVARRFTIQVSKAHIQRVELQDAGNVAHHRFNQHHALGSTKATKRGVALGVEFDTVRDDIYRL